MQKYLLRTKKLDKVIEYITNAVIPLKDGERAPGIRAIMQETQAGRRTVMHAIDQLSKDGVIKVEPKRGIFKRSPKKITMKFVCFIGEQLYPIKKDLWELYWMNYLLPQQVIIEKLLWKTSPINQL